VLGVAYDARGLIAIVTMVGASFAEQAGFRLTGHGTRWPLLIGLSIAVGVAVYVMVIDGLLFRGVLSSSYVQSIEANGLKRRRSISCSVPPKGGLASPDYFGVA
jgi:hypothetical protein